MRAVLRADAIFDLVVGVLLLSATWDGLFSALDLPHTEPELWMQVAGGLLVTFGYLLWIAPREPHLAHAVLGAAAFANGLAAVLLPLWILFGELDVGALGTALLFVLGKGAIGLYLGGTDPGSAYGAAGSLAVVLIWVYYSSMIVLFGTEFTRVWAERYGSGVRPEKGAVEVVQEERKVQRG